MHAFWFISALQQSLVLHSVPAVDGRRKLRHGIFLALLPLLCVYNCPCFFVVDRSSMPPIFLEHCLNCGAQSVCFYYHHNKCFFLPWSIVPPSFPSLPFSSLLFPSLLLLHAPVDMYNNAMLYLSLSSFTCNCVFACYCPYFFIVALTHTHSLSLGVLASNGTQIGIRSNTQPFHPIHAPPPLYRPYYGGQPIPSLFSLFLSFSLQPPAPLQSCLSACLSSLICARIALS